MNFKLALGTADLQKKPGFLLVEKALRKCGIFKDSYMNKNSHRPGWISFGKTLMATVLMQSQAMTDFQDISELNNNTIFVETLGRSISPETLRQHLNEIAEYDNVIPDIDSSVVAMLKGKKCRTVKHYGKSYIPLDIDVTPFHNPNVKKEEISKTYHKIDGFAPIMAYLGDFAIAFELRPGKQHSEKGAIEFLLRCLKIIDRLGINHSDILLRVDSAHDDGDFLNVLEEKHLTYIVKRNPRREPQKPHAQFAMENVPGQVSKDNTERLYYFVDSHKKPSSAPNIKGYAVFQVTEPYKDNNGCFQYPLLRNLDKNSPRFTYGREVPCEVESMWTNLPMSEKDKAKFGSAFGAACFGLYRDHATSEQYHSELKTDMDMELLPSKYFKTNKLFLALSVLAFNALRLIGNKALELDARLHHRKTRKLGRMCLRTVIDKLCTMACKVVRHARETVIFFGKKCQFYETFVKLYQ